jgi:O-antigen/teichoic acid export membrane protein
MSSGSSGASPQKTSILLRFGYLLSAQGTDALLSTGFFLYLAWLNSTFYGEVMYALAASSVVMTIVEFGLYYPLVVDLASAEKGASDRILVRVLLLKLILFIPAMLFVLGLTYYRGFKLETSLVFWLICFGVALDALAETFFANLRVKALQFDEAKIKIASTGAMYVFGFATAALGLPPVIIGLFRLVGGVIKLLYGTALNFQGFAISVWKNVRLAELKPVFANAFVFALIEILGNFYNKTNIFFLEKSAGMTGVAYYTATWNIVDGISILASSQFLGWVIFPILATTFSEDKNKLGPLVRNNALWLLTVAFPVIAVLFVESDLIIGLVYPREYADAVWMQRYLVWTIIFSFENNLFCYLMMVVGAGRMVLGFAVIVTAINLILNWTLINSYGLLGGCLVIMLTKMTMTVLTFSYCRIRFAFCRVRDFVFPVGAAAVAAVIFLSSARLIGAHAALGISLVVYGLIVFRWGKKFMGWLDGSV